MIWQKLVLSCLSLGKPKQQNWSGREEGLMRTLHHPRRVDWQHCPGKDWKSFHLSFFLTFGFLSYFWVSFLLLQPVVAHLPSPTAVSGGLGWAEKYMFKKLNRKMLERPNIWYIFEKLGVQGCQIWFGPSQFNSSPQCKKAPYVIIRRNSGKWCLQNLLAQAHFWWVSRNSLFPSVNKSQNWKVIGVLQCCKLIVGTMFVIHSMYGECYSTANLSFVMNCSKIQRNYMKPMNI